MTPAAPYDYRALARRRLPKCVFDYMDGGSYAEAIDEIDRDSLVEPSTPLTR